MAAELAVRLHPVALVVAVPWLGCVAASQAFESRPSPAAGGAPSYSVGNAVARRLETLIDRPVRVERDAIADRLGRPLIAKSIGSPRGGSKPFVEHPLTGDSRSTII